MEAHPVTLNDTGALARKLGISRWAVSRALNHQPGVGADTRARVLAEVAQGRFEPNAHARSLRGVGPAAVGLAVPTLRDPVWTPLAAGLCEGLIVRGLQPDLMLGIGGPEGEGRVWSRNAARHVAAVLVLGAGSFPPVTPGPDAPAAWGELRRRQVPVIFVEPAWDEEPDGLCVVRSDHRSAAALVTGYLHAHGHRRIELRGFREPEGSRVKAWRAAGEARGLSCAVRSSASEGDARLPPGGGPNAPSFPSVASRKTRVAVPSPTALVAADDLHALRVLCELRAAGRAVPGDVSLVGHGDEPAGALAAPALTTVDPQRLQLVARTLELLDELRQNPGGVQAGSIWIAPLLRCRASVANVDAASG